MLPTVTTFGLPVGLCNPSDHDKSVSHFRRFAGPLKWTLANKSEPTFL
jgi:hypothetical protein